MEGIVFDRITDFQAIEGDELVVYVTATVRINGKGPFYYRAKKSPAWRDELEAWARQQQADVARLMS